MKYLSPTLFLLALVATISCNRSSQPPQVQYGARVPGAHPVDLRIALDDRPYGKVTVRYLLEEVTLHVLPEHTVAELHDSLARAGVTALQPVIGADASPFECRWWMRGSRDLIVVETSGIGVYAEVVK